MLGNGSLRLDSARAEHSGKYKCRADNGVPPALSKLLNIHVNGENTIIFLLIVCYVDMLLVNY